MSHPSAESAHTKLGHLASHRPDHAPDTDDDATRALGGRLAEMGVPRPHIVAAEMIAALRRRGWRPTGITSDWQRAPGDPADPERVHEHAAAARRALAERMRPVPAARDAYPDGPTAALMRQQALDRELGEAGLGDEIEEEP
jgi:hypothetical protein